MQEDFTKQMPANNASSYMSQFRQGRAASDPETQQALDVSGRLRTSVLPWRGQFSPQLVEHFLERWPARRVLDPFCGSGTVLYECAATDREAIGVDISPAAIILASFASYCALSNFDRIAQISQMRDCVSAILAKSVSGSLATDDVRNWTGVRTPLLDCLFLTSFGDTAQISNLRLLKAMDALADKLMLLPRSKKAISARTGDARRLEIASKSIDLVVTSPPYINVFNYHQNFRPVTEALGYRPLVCAKAEIGSNRKNRQNRFITVLQYCIEMELALQEVWRVLRPRGTAVFVVGRSSTIRGVRFFNGELIAAIAELSSLFSIARREERTFVNRFGESIVEDILTLQSRPNETIVKIGRSVGAEALLSARALCSDQTRLREIEDAHSKHLTVEQSDYV